MRGWKQKALVIAAIACLTACSSGVEPSPLHYLTPSQRGALDRAEDGDARELHAFLIKSTDPRLDGEASELYSAELSEILNKLGPERMWVALQKETPEVRKAVEFYLDFMLRNNTEYYDLYRKLVPPNQRHDAQYDSNHAWQ
jgi:hypothetical protein